MGYLPAAMSNVHTKVIEGDLRGDITEITRGDHTEITRGCHTEITRGDITEIFER